MTWPPKRASSSPQTQPTRAVVVLEVGRPLQDVMKRSPVSERGAHGRAHSFEKYLNESNVAAATGQAFLSAS